MSPPPMLATVPYACIATAYPGVREGNAVHEVFEKASSSSQSPDDYLKRIFMELQDAIRDAAESGDFASQEEQLFSTCINASRLISCLPINIPPPVMAFDADGDLQMEWVAKPAHRLLLSIDSRNVLNYAAIFGGNAAFGNEDFVGEIPGVVWQAFRRVLG